MAFKKAVKGISLARIGLISVPGGGKTFTALRWAKVLAGEKRVRLLDTERSTALKYANLFDFDHDDLAPPYTSQRFVASMRDAIKDGQCGCLIIDSQSPAWEGEGGILDLVDKKGGGFDKWKDAKPHERALIEAWYSHPTHLIVTFRTATEYAMETVENRAGKLVSQPKKIGLKPRFKDGVEYELDLICYLDEHAQLTVTKTRIHELSGIENLKHPGEEMAQKILDWCEDGAVRAPQRLGMCKSGVELVLWCAENAKKWAESDQATQANLLERVEAMADGFGITRQEALVKLGAIQAAT